MIGDVSRIMLEFAEHTGLSSAAQPPRRYLWTDAHAVCNFLSLYRDAGDKLYLDLAVKLIDQVHHVLGRHRDDDPRRGWISGLDDAEGEKHPTAGGLRIGKARNERRPGDVFDERAEWDRDGQYFHYLTKWMHALCRAGAVSGDACYVRWSAELARAAQTGFATVSRRDGRRRLMWKMSIDLSYPLLPASGQHDPLDAYVTYHEIRARERAAEVGPPLAATIDEAAEMMRGGHWQTADPLGIGGLLFDAGRALQLAAMGESQLAPLAATLLTAARSSIADFGFSWQPQQPAGSRLAFRELGLSIGLRGVVAMRELARAQPGLADDGAGRDLEALAHYESMRREIETFWRQPSNQRVASFVDHIDINRVMLATSLLPDEFLKV